MSAVVTDTGPEKMKSLIDGMERFAKIEEAVGILDGHGGERIHKDSDLTNAVLMWIHEFGARSVGIPERTVIRLVYDKNRVELEKLLDEDVGKLIDGTIQPEHVYKRTGQFLVAKMKEYMKSASTPPPANKPSTVARKGFNNPLVDTGELSDLPVNVTRPKGKTQ